MPTSGQVLQHLWEKQRQISKRRSKTWKINPGDENNKVHHEERNTFYGGIGLLIVNRMEY
jgi:hypothetical protein